MSAYGSLAKEVEPEKPGRTRRELFRLKSIVELFPQFFGTWPRLVYRNHATAPSRDMEHNGEVGGRHQTNLALPCMAVRRGARPTVTTTLVSQKLLEIPQRFVKETAKCLR